MSVNCWEYNNCAKEPKGEQAKKSGECLALTYTRANGYLGGKNGGKSCCYITGSFCSGVLKGTSKEKEKQCGTCDFYKKLKKEHGAKLSVLSFAEYVRDKL